MDARERLTLLREEIHFEHQLISNRMNWYLTSQSFLMTAFAIAGGRDHPYGWLTALLPSIGIAISFLIFIGVLAAAVVVQILRARERELIAASREVQDAPYQKLPMWTHVFGMAGPLLLPIIFVLAWYVCLTK